MTLFWIRWHSTWKIDKTYEFDTMHKSDISDVKTILIQSCHGPLLAIEPTSLYYFISKDSNHVQGDFNQITFVCTPYMLFVLILH